LFVKFIPTSCRIIGGINTDAIHAHSLSNHGAAAKVSHRKIVPLPFAGRAPEDIPKPQSLVGRGGNHAAAIWTLIHVKNPGSMTLELLNLRHGRILPQDELILAKAVARAYLPLVLRPQQRANLAPRVDRVEHGPRVGIPELDGPVGRAAPGGEEAAVKGTPRQGLHRGPVLRQCEPRADVRHVEVAAAVVAGRPSPTPTGHRRVPQTEQILVPAAREGAPLVVPPQTANLLRVSHVRAHDVIPAPNVVLHDEGIPSPRAEPVLVPAKRADPRAVPVERSQPTFGLGVPELDDVVIRANGDVVAVPLVPHPRHARHEVGILPQRKQVTYVPRVCLPQVHALPEGDGEDVRFAPANEVEVVIVDELGRVEYPRGGLGYATSDALRDVAQSVLGLGERVEGRARRGAVRAAVVV